ncbi:MAG TPA: AbrB/MazE/SpoVT family DNA-binding domain-containing protein [Candidatus Agathobaculum pullicola]|nr:AbrB/MazE/SpoVT family DNA-binding domain-containing protein [Candidatus Agathobaculum pullicola]
MKATGIIRKVDELGRIVLPKELRDQRELFNGTPVEVFVDGKDIILRKYIPGCMFCGESDHLHSIDGILICPDCARKYAKQFAQVAQED